MSKRFDTWFSFDLNSSGLNAVVTTTIVVTRIFPREEVPQSEE
jgi:hypothetical protein